MPIFAPKCSNLCIILLLLFQIRSEWGTHSVGIQLISSKSWRLNVNMLWVDMRGDLLPAEFQAAVCIVKRFQYAQNGLDWRICSKCFTDEGEVKSVTGGIRSYDVQIQILCTLRKNLFEKTSSAVLRSCCFPPCTPKTSFLKPDFCCQNVT